MLSFSHICTLLRGFDPAETDLVEISILQYLPASNSLRIFLPK